MEFKAIYTGEGIYSNTKQAQDLNKKSCYGEIKNGRVHYSLVEALYLMEEKKMEVNKIKRKKEKKLTFNKLINEIKKLDKKIRTKYSVYKNLRNKGYIIKTALKFGAEFRVYEKGKRPGKGHAKWILYTARERDKAFTWHEFCAKNRVAHSTRKKLLIGIVDEEEDVTYYEIGWVKA